MILLFSAFSPSRVYTQEDDLRYSAEDISLSPTSNLIILKNSSRLVFQDMVLTADTVYYNTEENTLEARGNPRLEQGGDTLRGAVLYYDLENERGRVREGNFIEPADSARYMGEEILRDSSEAIFIQNGYYTTSFTRPPQYSLFSPKFKLLPDEQALARPLVLLIQKSPVITLPFFIIPLDDERKAGWLTPRWGVGIHGSGYVDNIGYYWGKNPYFDIYLAGRVNDFERYQVKTETRYHIRDKLRGSIYGDFTLNDSYKDVSNRWSLRYDHEQNILPDKSLTLSGSGQFVSDNRYYRDYFRDTTDILQQELRSRLTLRKNITSLGGYASLGFDRTENLQKPSLSQTLPSLRLSLGNHPLFPGVESPLLENFSWSYSAQAKNHRREYREDRKTHIQQEAGMHHSIPVRSSFTLRDNIDIQGRFTINQSVFNTYHDTTTRIEKDTVVHRFDTISVDKYIQNPDLHSPHDSLVEMEDTSFYLYNRYDSLYTIHRYDTLRYGDPDFSAEEAHTAWWNSAISAQTQFFGIFPVHIGPAEGLRHTVTPRIEYSLTPRKELIHAYPGIVPSARGTEQKQNIKFSLGNDFDAKYRFDGTEGKTTLLNTSVSGSYTIEGEEHKWGFAVVEAQIPSQSFSLSYSGTYSPYDDDILIFPWAQRHHLTITPAVPRVSGNLWSGDMFTHRNISFPGYLGGAFSSPTEWSLNLSPSYRMSLHRESPHEAFRQDKSYLLNSSLSLDISHRWNLRWSGRWSFQKNTFINQNLSLAADLNSWDLKFNWYPTGITSGHINLVIGIKRHREIKWDHHRI
jgi:lipopolysaccharide assembly outer membrane protein LptD (OstA)